MSPTVEPVIMFKETWNDADIVRNPKYAQAAAALPRDDEPVNLADLLVTATVKG